jgi:DNA-binding GntR family transcriptional regulator
MGPSSEIIDRLRRRIVTGELAPGAPMRQETLAAELGVSRLPVRDALYRLEAEGLVEVGPDRGAYVSTLSPAACAEIFDLRTLLECEALAHAIPNHSPRTVREIELVQAGLESEDETPRWISGDRRFHELLYAPAGRPQTLKFVTMLRNVVDRFYLAHLRHDARRERWKAEHRRLIQSVKEGDLERATSCLTGHLRATLKVCLDTIGRARRATGASATSRSRPIRAGG